MKNSKILPVICLTFAFILSLLTVKIDLDNRALKTTVASQQKEINTLQDQSKNLQSENEMLVEKNQKLTQENTDLINVFNQKNLELNKAAQSGTAKPSHVGISPSFTLVSASRGGFDRYQRQNLLDNLAKDGSYQYQKETIPFDVNDCKSWPDLGNWYVSCYTATAGECDSNPSVTASGKLVTPSFTMAVDNNFWKFGTIFYIEGLGFGVAADTGSAIKGKNRADFLVASKTFANLASGNRRVYLVYTPD